MMLLAATVLVILGVWWSVNQIRVREAETRDALALAESARADAEDALHLFRTEQAEKIAIGDILELAHRVRPTSDHPAWKTLANLKQAERDAAGGKTLADVEVW